MNLSGRVNDQHPDSWGLNRKGKHRENSQSEKGAGERGAPREDGEGVGQREVEQAPGLMNRQGHFAPLPHPFAFVYKMCSKDGFRKTEPRD